MFIRTATKSLAFLLLFRTAVFNEKCTEDGLKLIELINVHRDTISLPRFQVSQNLCLVANVKTDEMVNCHEEILSRCYMKGCPLHSWLECCFLPHNATVRRCMSNKPREIAGFDADGRELTVWEKNYTLTAETAFKSLMEREKNRKRLLMDWVSIGAAVDGRYANVWLSTTTDRGSELEL